MAMIFIFGLAKNYEFLTENEYFLDRKSPKLKSDLTFFFWVAKICVLYHG